MADLDPASHTLTEMTTTIAEAYLANNQLRPSDVSQLLHDVHGALKRAMDGRDQSQATAVEPAVLPSKAVKKSRIYCLECGKGYKTLKRHLKSAHNLDPKSYRQRWGLSSAYPMVAPDYAAARSQLAKDLGLGHGSSG